MYIILLISGAKSIFFPQPGGLPCTPPLETTGIRHWSGAELVICVLPDSYRSCVTVPGLNERVITFRKL